MESITIKVSVLASGSAGNSTLLITQNQKILIDIGTSCLYIEKNLKELNINPKEINAIFITHTHIDHISGLQVFLKRYNPIVYLSEKMHQEIKSKIKLINFEYIDKNIIVDELEVEVIKTSHDTEDSNGYIFQSFKKSLVYITDTGYLNKNYYPLIKNKDMYIMESNHDVSLLMKTDRPHFVKIRIMGDKGHLSNIESSYHLSNIIGDKTKHIILAHLSEEANKPNLAKKTLLETLAKQNKEVENVIIAKQKDRTKLIEL